MKLTGAITTDGGYGCIDVEGDTYDEAWDNLYARLEDGQKLITIRTDR